MVRSMITRGSLLVLLALGAAAAQTAETQEEVGGRSVLFGTTTIDGRQWERLSFRPEIPLGKAAVALDIELFLDQQGAISSKGWEFGNSTEIMNTIYRKIYYIRYGMPGQPIYAKVGALDDVTLGYGFLMSHYRNTLSYPGIKNLGAQIELNPLYGLNVQAVLNNFLDISTGGPLVGVRVAKPFGRFEVGGTIVYDFDQYGGLADSDGDGVPDGLDRFPRDRKFAADTDRDGIPDEKDRDADGDGRIDVDFGGNVLSQVQRDSIDGIMRRADLPPFEWDTYPTALERPFNKKSVGRDPFGMVGADIGFKLIDKPALKLITYGQLGMSLDDADSSRATGWGIGAPGLWLVVGPLNGRIEYRHLRNEFMPEYFDNLYDHTRVVANLDSGSVITKDALLDSLEGQKLDGVFGDVTLALGNFARVTGRYQYLHGRRSQQQVYAVAALGQSTLQMVPKLSRLEAFYGKRNIGLYGDSFFERTLDTTYGYDVGFALGGGVEVVWATRWLFEPVAADPADVRARRQVTLETVVRF